ncbi:phage portal protein [Schleiferilactobacillus perolens]|uniref:phage portal protein n=1 Tax=Schleiferilactobacillus perolens TaxID=100468 RepID=UPI002357ABE3|nr:phage portal protein [Schleiferilactobacillus perolens]MCI2170675.1 phage portal protein [Schleiferilactobacillus perolens]
MSVIDTIKQWFRKGGAKIGMVQSLQAITDHPKINIDPDEYKRIAVDKQYFEGRFPKIKLHNTDGKMFERPYVTLNMMQVICRRLSSLLYNEQCKILVDTQAQTDSDDDAGPSAPDEADKFVHSVLADNDFNKNFERYLESALALGGLCIRPYVDPSTKTIKLAWIQAPNFFPLRSNTNDISEAAIATPTVKTINGNRIYYTLLEFHEWHADGYTITNELYRSDVAGQVGIKVPLGELYPGMAEVAQMDAFSRPLFVYLKPAGFNNRNITSPLGLGICDNARNTLKQINDAFDQFNWEVQMGQRRVAVPDSMIQLVFEKDGMQQPRQIFDQNQNVFIPIAGGGPDDTKIQDLTTPIRSTDYTAALNHFLKTLEMQVGLSAGTFSFDAQGLKTATEVVSENSMTYQTRNSHLTMVERAIKELCVSICELAKSYGLYVGSIPTPDQVSVDFDDGVFTDKAASLDYWTKALAAGIVPKYIAIERALGVPEDVAKRYAAEISDSITTSTPPSPNDVVFGGGDG